MEGDIRAWKATTYQNRRTGNWKILQKITAFWWNYWVPDKLTSPCIIIPSQYYIVWLSYAQDSQVLMNQAFWYTFSISQVWLAVYQLLMNEDCQRKYEFNSYSKEQILKVIITLLKITYVLKFLCLFASVTSQVKMTLGHTLILLLWLCAYY